MSSYHYSSSSPKIHPDSSNDRARLDSHYQTLTLDNGCTLGFATYGIPFPVSPNSQDTQDTHNRVRTIFHLHSFTSSRLEAANFDHAARSLNARVVGIDRPGLGLSSAYPKGRRRRIRFWKRVEPKVTDWPEYVVQLARFLGVQKSGLPREELLGVGVMASVWPWDVGRERVWSVAQEGMEEIVDKPQRIEKYLDRTAAADAWEEDGVNAWNAMGMTLEMLPRCDKEVFKKDGGRHMRLCMEAEREGYRQGAGGAVQNMRLTALDWGFRLENIAFEGIRLFYGEEDDHVPVEMGRYYAEVLPNAVFREFRGKTNVKVFTDCAEEVLRSLLRASNPR